MILRVISNDSISVKPRLFNNNNTPKTIANVLISLLLKKIDNRVNTNPRPIPPIDDMYKNVDINSVVNTLFRNNISAITIVNVNTHPKTDSVFKFDPATLLMAIKPYQIDIDRYRAIIDANL